MKEGEKKKGKQSGDFKKGQKQRISKIPDALKLKESGEVLIHK